ncbi:MAG: extracellular solute-binding protein [Clostridia bacterium]|nr:extracellular solute-binding protein [Clostridia bacterium]
MRKNRTHLLLLTAAMLLPLIASCGSDAETKTEDPVVTEPSTVVTEAADTEVVYDPNLPDMDFGGATFTIAMRGEDYNNDFTIDSTTGDPVDDAVYARMDYIENTYNVDLELMWCGDSSTVNTGSPMYTKLTKLMMAGDNAFDAINTSPYCQAGLAAGGYLLDLNEIKYINLDQPWWDQNAKESLSFYDCVYFSTGDITTGDDSCISVLLFNKSIITEFDLDNPYDDVRNGTWTIDKMITNCKAVTGDIDGNGKQDEFDRWGFTFWQDAIFSMMLGTGATVGKTDENGVPTYTATDPFYIDAYNKVLQLVDKQYSYNQKMDAQSGGYNHWAAGNALYYWGMVRSVTGQRSSDIDFGIIPMPKYSEDQDRYYSEANAYSTSLVSVPMTVTDPDRSGLILEALAAYGKQVVSPAYLDNLVMVKSVRDEDSAEMLQLIFDSQVFDVGYFFNWGNTLNSTMDLLNTRKDTIASTLEKISKKVEKDVQATIDAFTAN